MGGRRRSVEARVLGHPRFRAAYDFLLLRAEAGEVERELGEWWTQFQEMHPEQREQEVTRTRPPRKRRRRRPRRKSGKEST